MKSGFKGMLLVLCMMCVMAFASPVCIYATDLDGLSSGSSTNSSTSHGSGDNTSISDYLKGYNPVTQDNMDKAGTMASPIVNALGTLSGFIIMLVSAGIFVVTALDLAYIGIPFLRTTLNPNYGAGAQGGSPMGGMGMGMGMRGGMGMGGMGMGGDQPAAPGRKCWVSDEAVACVQMASQGQAQGGSPMGGGMGMMGGGMGMGGMGMGGAQAQPMPTKSVILEYLKKRTFFLIIFAIATVLLMSSIFTDCGLNIAELGIRVMHKLNGSIQNINV